MIATVAALDYCTNSYKGFVKNKKSGIAILFFAVDILGTIVIFQFVLLAVSRGEVQIYDLSPRVAWVLGWLIVAALTLSTAIRSVGNLLRSDTITLRALFEGRSVLTMPIYSTAFAVAALGVYTIAVHSQFPREFGGGRRPLYIS